MKERIRHGSLDSDQPAAYRAHEIISKRTPVSLHYIVHLALFVPVMLTNFRMVGAFNI